MSVSQPSGSAPAGRLHLLDGMRGLAALSVALMHDAMAYELDSPFLHAFSAVDLFFLLSGFVLTRTFDPRFRAGLGAAAFMRLRLSKLWWIMALGILLGIPVYLGEFTANALVLFAVMTMLFLPAPAGIGQVYGLNAPCWSLTCEFIMNAVHALWLWSVSDRTLILISAVSGALLAIAVHRFGSADIGSGLFNWPGGLLRIGFAYPIGMLLARHIDRFKPTRCPWWLALALSIAPMILLAPFLHLIWLSYAFTILVLPVTFWIAVRATCPQSWNRVMTWLGAISYPLYAVHWPLIYLGRNLGEEWSGGSLELAASSPARFIALVSALTIAALIARHENSRRSQRSKPSEANAIPA